MKNDHIVAPTHIQAANDAQAMLKASELLTTSPFDLIEVWQETRVVGAVPAPAPPDEYDAKLDDEDPHSSESRGSNIVEFRK
jgi:hypothetical protein